MWMTFALACLVCLMCLIVPGYLFLRGFRIPIAYAVAISPAVSTALFSVIPIILPMAGLKCGGWLLLSISVLLAAAVFLAGFFARRKMPRVTPDRCDLLVLAYYVLIGAVICGYVFVSSLGQPEAFFCRWDNMSHLNLTRSFLDSGSWSSLDSSYFTGTGIETSSETPRGFYPAGWNDIVALVASLTGAPLTVAVNAVNAVIIGIVYPLGVYAVLKALFPQNRQLLVIGGFMALAFVAFPWRMLLKGPLTPNMLADALILAVVALFLVCTEKKYRVSRAFDGLRILVLGLVSVAALALSQSNALFALYVCVVPLLAVRGREALVKKRPQWKRKRLTVLLYYITAVVAAALVWLLMMKLPFLQPVVSYNPKGDANMTVLEAAYNTLSFGFNSKVPQWILVALSVVGAVGLLKKGRWWLLVGPTFSLAAYFLTRTTNRAIKFFFAGFWYSDPTRLAALAAIFLVPVASYGIWLVVRWLARACAKRNGAQGAARSANIQAVAGIAVCCVLAIALYIPGISAPYGALEVKTPFGQLRASLSNAYRTNPEQVYSEREQAFVKEVESVIPANAVVINFPHDGSVFAYGVDGLNTYFRNASLAGKTKTSEIIRTGLKNIEHDKAVQEAVQSIGARYVMLLDKNVSYDDGVWMPQNSPNQMKQWEGITGVDEDTPGFKVVLSEGDMRLYEITA